MTDIAIKVENLSKRYRIGQYVGSGAQYKTLRESLTNAVSAPLRRLGDRRRKTEDRSPVSGRRSSNPGPPSPVAGPPSTDRFIWALKDVSFEVKQGEVLGIIGRNGAGKSTLLKVLARITEPTKGRAELNGRVGSLLEVGTGFHPELTGRENIYLSGAILGMARKEIDRKFDEIVDFSGVETYIDTPVKRYSSGMRVRLGFAVAAHLEPEILLIDEVLAVGDAAFQKKCLGKMGAVAGEGRTVLFVSHNMGMINTLCGGCILFESGKIVQEGETSLVISKYLSNLSSAKGIEQSFPEDRTKKIQIRRVAVMGQGLNAKTQFDVFEQVAVEIEYQVREELIGSLVSIALYREGVNLFQSSDTDHNQEFLKKRLPGYYRARVNLPCPLKAGGYTIDANAGIANSGWIDNLREALGFEVEEFSFDPSFRSYSRGRAGIIVADLVWETEYLREG